MSELTPASKETASMGIRSALNELESRFRLSTIFLPSSYPTARPVSDMTSRAFSP
jgi:hypothetical protein